MQVVGYVAVAVVAAGFVVGLGLTVRSLPDINRYRKIRKM
ncbi:MAG: DUF6893 family small protein [Acidimicrobiales bacterium]